MSKRYLQHKPLETAIKCSNIGKEEIHAVDLGAGNGELCKQVSKYYKNVKITCYEPNESMLAQAKENLKETNVRIVTNINTITNNSMDLV